MPPSELLEFIRKRPFVPFRIEMTDGKGYEIQHPELVMPGITTAIIGLPADPAQPFYDRWETIALRHVIRLVPKLPAVESGTNSSPS